MRGLAVRPIVIAAGGTGGHFFPAEALAGELASRGHRVALMTDARSAGLHSPAFTGRETFVLKGAGVAGRGLLRAAGGGLSLVAGTGQARRILAGLNAAAIVGFGGYPCVAPVVAARLLRQRTAVILHEQNAVLGRANRALARLADRLALSLSHTTRLPGHAATVVTGNPVRTGIRGLYGRDYLPPDDSGPIRLLVTGGSQGARVFSAALPAAVAQLPEALRARLNVVQQCRPEDLDAARAAYAAHGVRAELSAFFPDIAERLLAAHFVVARAGASTVAELAVAGRPALLVPLPGSIDGHQLQNARAVGADVLEQHEFEHAPRVLAEALAARLPCPDLLAMRAHAIAEHGIPDAAARLADLVEETALHGTEGARA